MANPVSASAQCARGSRVRSRPEERRSSPEGSANFDADGPGQGVRTTAVLDGNEWVINGRKAWASHLCGWDGDGPDIMTIVCRTPGGISLVVAERAHLAGKIEVEEYYDLPGLKGCLTTCVMLRDVARAARQPARGARPGRRTHPQRVLSQRRLDRRVRRRRDAAGLRHRLPLRAHPGPELALHAKILGSTTGVEVINDLIQIVGVTVYDQRFPIFGHLMDALSYPIIEGSNVGVRRRQLQALFRTPDYNPLHASGMA